MQRKARESAKMTQPPWVSWRSVTECIGSNSSKKLSFQTTSRVSTPSCATPRRWPDEVGLVRHGTSKALLRRAWPKHTGRLVADAGRRQQASEGSSEREQGEQPQPLSTDRQWLARQDGKSWRGGGRPCITVERFRTADKQGC